jgi:hypothetical protein
MGVSETILAAMIGAGATLFTAVFNLVSAFRKSSGDRRTVRSSFRSLMWMLALMLAAGVGGFAYAEFRAQQSRDEDRALRVELQQQMQALAQSTARLEQLRLPAPGGTVTDSAATVNLPACKGAQVGFATQRGPCTEQDALHVTVCAPVPAAARVTAVELFARPEDSVQAWADARVAAGQEIAAGRFTGTHFERPDGEGGKLVCQSFAHWNSDKGRAVRILVRFGA